MSERALPVEEVGDISPIGVLPSQLSSRKHRINFRAAVHPVTTLEEKALSSEAVILDPSKTRTAGTPGNPVEPASNIALRKRKAAILGTLFELYVRTLAVGWDGYDALPLTAGSISYALEFLSLLPTTVPNPELAVDSDGEVAIEWNFGARQIFSVRVGSDGSLHYAGLIGHTARHGKVRFEDPIPNAILNGINNVVRSVEF